MKFTFYNKNNNNGNKNDKDDNNNDKDDIFLEFSKIEKSKNTLIIPKRKSSLSSSSCSSSSSLYSNIFTENIDRQQGIKCCKYNQKCIDCYVDDIINLYF